MIQPGRRAFVDVPLARTRASRATATVGSGDVDGPAAPLYPWGGMFTITPPAGDVDEWSDALVDLGFTHAHPFRIAQRRVPLT